MSTSGDTLAPEFEKASILRAHKIADMSQFTTLSMLLDAFVSLLEAYLHQEHSPTGGLPELASFRHCSIVP
jgi:hypothetical protein